MNKVDPSFPFHQGMESATTESIEGRRTLLKEKAQRPILLPIRRGLACIVEGEARGSRGPVKPILGDAAHPDSDLIVGRSAGQVEGDQESMSSSELASFKLI